MSESAEKIMGKAAARGAAVKPKGIGVIEACQYVGCGQTKMWELIKDGKVQTYRLGRRRLVVTDSLDRLAEQNTV